MQMLWKEKATEGLDHRDLCEEQIGFGKHRGCVESHASRSALLTGLSHYLLTESQTRCPNCSLAPSPAKKEKSATAQELRIVRQKPCLSRCLSEAKGI